jgi:hypothetical protein
MTAAQRTGRIRDLAGQDRLVYEWDDDVAYDLDYNLDQVYGAS